MDIRQTLTSCARQVPMGAVVVAMSLTMAGCAVVELQCDGEVEAWRIADSYDGGGCAELAPEWQGIFPWNGDKRLICLGLCGPDSLPWPPPPIP